MSVRQGWEMYRREHPRAEIGSYDDPWDAREGEARDDDLDPDGEYARAADERRDDLAGSG